MAKFPIIDGKTERQAVAPVANSRTEAILNTSPVDATQWSVQTLTRRLGISPIWCIEFEAFVDHTLFL